MAQMTQPDRTTPRKAAVEWQGARKGACSVFESRTAQNSDAYRLPILRAIKDSNPRVVLLDVGAGNRSISATLAQLIPEGDVTAVDINPDVIPHAKDVAKSFDVTKISFPDG